MKRENPAQAAAQEGERRLPMVGDQGQRSAQFIGASYSADSRSVEAVLSSGAAVRRYWMTEELEISPDAIDLSRVDKGLCRLLNCHNQWEMNAVLGKVSNCRIEDGNLTATLTFAETDQGREAEGMVSRGELTGVSIGYRVNQWQIVTVDEAGHETWRATRWELLEVSLVPVPADPNAGVRSAQGELPPVSGVSAAINKDDDMNRSVTPGGAAAPAPVSAAPAPGAAPAAEPVRAVAPAADPAPAGDPAAPQFSRFTPTTALAFIAQARSLGVEDAATDLVRANEAGTVSVEAASTALLARAAEAQQAETAAQRAGPRASVGADSREQTRMLVIDALAARTLRTPVPDAAREFGGVRLLELAAQRAGMPNERDYTTIMRAAMTSSDFPLILEAVANKVLLARYATAPRSFQAIARQRDLTDFKPTKLLSVGDFPSLKKYGEDSEITFGTINEGREQVVLGSYARNLRLSRQAIVNDDLNAFDDVIGGIGNMIALFENDTFYTMKAQNSGAGPKLGDGKNLFHADHGNLASSGAAISVATVGAGRAAIRKQKNLDSKPLNLAPATMLVGPDQETLAEQFLAPAAWVTNDTVNPFSQKLSLVVDALITGNAWELYTDPAQLPVFHYGYLAGESGPRVLTEEGFNYDGMGWSVRMDFYAGATDHRGGWRNPGA